jgi:hypothetical protein
MATRLRKPLVNTMQMIMARCAREQDRVWLRYSDWDWCVRLEQIVKHDAAACAYLLTLLQRFHNERWLQRLFPAAGDRVLVAEHMLELRVFLTRAQRVAMRPASV